MQNLSPSIYQKPVIDLIDNLNNNLKNDKHVPIKSESNATTYFLIGTFGILASLKLAHPSLNGFLNSSHLFKQFKHLKHSNLFQDAASKATLSTIGFAVATVSAMYYAGQSLGAKNDAERNLSSLAELRKYHQDAEYQAETFRDHQVALTNGNLFSEDMKNIDSVINDAESLFSKKRNSATLNLVIRISCVFAGILGLGGSMLNAPGIMLIGGISLTVLTGISLLKNQYDRLGEKAMQTTATKVSKDLEKLQKSFNSSSQQCFYKKPANSIVPLHNLEALKYNDI